MDKNSPEQCILCHIDMDVVGLTPGGNYKRRITRYECQICGYKCIGRNDHEKRIERGEVEEEG